MLKILLSIIFIVNIHASNCNGSGEIKHENATYKGECKNDAKHGYGVLSNDNGSSYSGDWVMGQRDGKGRYVYTSGAVYDGDWLKNKKDGQGKYMDLLGSVYIGSFKSNKKDGYGVLTYKSGESYDGHWRDGKKEGKGVLTYANGMVYDGLWADDAKDGSGIETTQYGTCKGVWKNGNMLSIIEESSLLDVYKYFDKIRITAGMSSLRSNPILELSAQNHSKYIDTHHKTSNEKAKDRAIKAGYFSTNISEGVSTHCSAKQSINSLMSAIYQRFDILTFSKNELGIGFTKDANNLKHNLVYNTGNSNLNILCQGGSVWFGNYYENVCADKEQKIKIDPYNEAKEKIKEKNPKYVIWPADGSLDNLYYFEDEGYPISIQFNPYYFAKKLVVSSFKLYDAKGEVTETKLLSKQTDLNKKFTKNQFALFPLKPLQKDTEYKAIVKYKYEGDSKEVISVFRTKK